MVKKISEDTKRKILEKSAYALPDRPSERGLPVSTIKNAFYKPILDEEASIVSEVNRIVDEINANNEGNAELEELRNDIAALQESKQDVLVAGDGIKIEGNVISAIGGGAPSGFKVKYYDGEYSFYFYTEEKLNDSYELMDYLRNNEHNYDNPLPVYDALYNGCVDSLEESAGLYEESGDLYILIPAYEEYWYVYEDCFDFSGGSSGGEEDNVPYYAEYDGFVFYFDAPAGLHDASDVYEWLQRNEHTYYESLYDVRDCYYDGMNYSSAGIYADGGVVILHDNEDHRDLCQIEYFDYFQENP